MSVLCDYNTKFCFVNTFLKTIDMKARFALPIFVVVLMCLFTQVATAQYDDLYYNPATDQARYYPIAKVESAKAAASERYATTEEGEYRNSDDDEEGEYAYSSRIRRFHNRNRSFDYDFYDNSPMFGGYNNYSSFDNRYSNSFWNSYCWNRNSYFNTYNGWDNYFYNPYNGFNSFNSWGYSPYSYGNYYNVYNNYYGSPYGYNNYDPYWSGYNHGFNNGYNNNSNGQGGHNGGVGLTSGNPKGTYYGPRTTGSSVTPTSPRSGREVAPGNGSATGTVENPSGRAQNSRSPRTEEAPSTTNDGGWQTRRNSTATNSDSDAPTRTQNGNDTPRRNNIRTDEPRTNTRSNDTPRSSTPRRETRSDDSPAPTRTESRSNNNDSNNSSRSNTSPSSPRSESSGSGSSSGGSSGSGRRGGGF